MYSSRVVCTYPYITDPNLSHILIFTHASVAIVTVTNRMHLDTMQQIIYPTSTRKTTGALSRVTSQNSTIVRIIPRGMLIRYSLSPVG